MASGLDVWIAKPGAVCRMDEDTWHITVTDAHDQIFQWAGLTYADLEAAHAHWASSIPPGTYVVSAVNKTSGARTDHAICVVPPGQLVYAVLYVSTGRPPECEITIDDVSGVQEDATLTTVRVDGSAAGCQQVEVSIACRTEETLTVLIPVSAGTWTALFEHVNHAETMECRCGGPVLVKAHCIEHPECATELRIDHLRCTNEDET